MHYNKFDFQITFIINFLKTSIKEDIKKYFIYKRIHKKVFYENRALKIFSVRRLVFMLIFK